ncbi:hypothetical protein GC170_22410 [bacterium]|nr:hypothetical protein [bacterium]
MPALANFLLSCITITLAQAPAEPANRNLHFRESFENTDLLDRGFYDGKGRFTLDDDAAEGKKSLRYRFEAGQILPADSEGVRRKFEPVESVYVSFRMKLSSNWKWTGRPYGPHFIYFMTNENGRFHGPAASRLTVYVEPVNGRLRLAAQDIQNKDAPNGLTQGPLKGGYNGKFYDSEEILFDDGKWHFVEAVFRLNTLDETADKPNRDGIARGWVDGKLVVDRTDVIFRSTDFPKMKFDQFLMAPYFHHGVPHEQTLLIDDLAVGTDRPESISSR